MTEEIISTEQDWLQTDCDFSALNSVGIAGKIGVLPVFSSVVRVAGGVPNGGDLAPRGRTRLLTPSCILQSFGLEPVLKLLISLTSRRQFAGFIFPERARVRVVVAIPVGTEPHHC